ncbi:hypothetical protein ACP4OV_026919 [Aristida adscensionis]
MSLSAPGSVRVCLGHIVLRMDQAAVLCQHLFTLTKIDQKKQPSKMTGLSENKRTYAKMHDNSDIAHLSAALPLNPASLLSHASHLGSTSENVSIPQHNALVLADIAKNTVQEFILMASSCPLWQPVHRGSLEVLNKVEYAKRFPWKSNADETGLKTQATRSYAVVMMDPKIIVDFIMDGESYVNFFPGILSSVAISKVYNWSANSNAGYDGAMQLMTTEVVFPSPLVPARRCTFLRYCKHLQNGAIVVVSVPLEDSEGTSFRCHSRCHSMPSGLLIEPLINNSCKVTAIEHVRLGDTGIFELIPPCLSGLLFGARRWVMSIARQGARIIDVSCFANNMLHVSSNARRTMIKMADHLLANYTGSVAAVPTGAWTLQCGEGTKEDVKILYRRNDDGSNTAVVCASASFLVPVPMRRAFDMLRNNMLRAKWDNLVNGSSVNKEVRIAKGVGSDDAVSILHVKHGKGAQDETMVILQNSSYDVSGSFMVYSSLEKGLIGKIMREQAISNVALLPSGFSLIPLPNTMQSGSAITEDGGTLITSCFHILMNMPCGTGMGSQSVSSTIKIMQDQIHNVEDMLMSRQGCYYKRIKITI